MPKVRFEPDGIEIEVPIGTSILESSQKAHAQVGSACGGVCACSTCHVYVKEGLGALTDPSDREEDIMDKAFDVKSNSRLGCQSKILRDVTALVGTASDAYHSDTGDACQLTGHASHGAGRRADHHRFASFGLHDLVESVPRGHARHAHGAQIS